MKKFVVLTYGFTPLTEKVRQEWGAWFAAVEPRLVDPGNPRRRTHDDQPHRTDFMRRPFDPSIAHHH